MIDAAPPPTASPGKRGLRVAGAANATIAVVMLVIIGLVAVRVNQSPPPTVAELQPASRQQIKDAPPGQAPVIGPGESAGQETSPSPSLAVPSPLPSPEPSVPPRVHQCYGGRQTADPQSPPCVPFFDPTQTSNGGATATGVTGDTIYVSWPLECGFCERPTDTTDMLAYFNHHYELYGRRVVLEQFVPTASGGDPAAMQKDAATAAAGEGTSQTPHATFASLSYIPEAGAEHYFYDALARNHVISVNVTPTATDEPHFDQFQPYEWSVTPGLDYDEKNLAQMTCNALNGKPPKYAGTGTSNAASRVFAIGFTKAGDGSLPDVAPLSNGLSACNAPVPVNESASNSNQFILDAKSKGVTSIMCVCSVNEFGGLMKSATSQQYFPEWIVHHYQFQDQDTAGSPPGAQFPYPNEQHPGVFGLTFENKILSPDQSFWFSAIREEDPGYTYGDNGADLYDMYRYQEMMVLFAGLQLAGPHLTADAFQQGMFRSRFPDPGHGAAPYYQAAVGFGPGLHSYFNDAAPTWWSDQAQNYTTQEPRTGSYCYVAGGVRYGPGQWPATINFFGGQACR